jgi:hypothetical protein
VSLTPCAPRQETLFARAAPSGARLLSVHVPSIEALSIWAVRAPAPALESRTGVTIAGQTFGAATTTRELTRTNKITTLQPTQHRYVVELAPASAALLSVGAS